MTNLNHAQSTTYQQPDISASTFVGNGLLQESILWKLILLTGLTYLIWSDRVSIVLGPTTEPSTEQFAVKKVRAGLFDFSIDGPKKDKPGTEVKVKLPAGSLNNVTLAIDPDYAKRNHITEAVLEKRFAACREYISRFAPVAIAEMRRSGIPASIILAQGLLESNAGASNIARTANNHFGIKCFSTHCKKGHCINSPDDSHKDFFIKYENAWGSFRAHSDFIGQSGRYVHLFDLDSSNYRGWARGLAKAGYTTDKLYGEKLIAIIQTMELYQYDKQDLP